MFTVNALSHGYIMMKFYFLCSSGNIITQLDFVLYDTQRQREITWCIFQINKNFCVMSRFSFLFLPSMSLRFGPGLLSSHFSNMTIYLSSLMLDCTI